jgi:UDP-3-O-acyl-N-acetylglucosamine deacetylase
MRLRGFANAPRVVLVTPERIEVAGAPFSPDEPARHKLLDLVGDLFLYGGPPVGEVHGTRPSHASTHAAITEARALGILEERT